MEAITREEKIISGENLTPITRKEMFLAKASGQNIETPTPITREEIFLSKISGDGGGTNSPLAYTLSSVDELPTNAVDGSMAMIEVPHKLLGTWLFNDVINNMPFNGFEVDFESNGVNYTVINAYGVINYSDNESGIDVYESSTGWADENLQTIKIIGGKSDELAEWLNKDAVQIEAGIAYELYVRENGKWVYKGEVA